MTRNFHLSTLLLACAAMLPFMTQAQTQLSVGQRLTPEQVQSQRTLFTVQIDDKTYKVIEQRQTPAGLPLTLLLSSEGVVGQSLHEVLIDGVAPDTVWQKAATALATASAVKAYERLNMTIARYPTLAQATQATVQIRKAVPTASVGLPITFELPRTQSFVQLKFTLPK